MNTVTLNGVNSTMYAGLLIQELPAITRPKMRVQQTTVDGRSGDIITDLGYDSYDRELRVGLHGCFDIDAIISFFSGKGEAIFSNEPEKIYNYQFIEKVDYTRLLKYKTAKIKMHVQPYKHSSVDGTVVGTSGSVEVYNSGNIDSAPTLDIVGTGTVQVSVPGGAFQVDMSNDLEVIVDTEKLEAYYGNALKNRLVTGNLKQFRLKPGMNTIEWTGSVTEIGISRYSRWI